ncbi:MAG: N-acetyltransferase [Candidatus Marsarchaeota archaeon]|nr:N-acetyltransferase [Candidatus Marsarchaeota archaeon]
MPGVGWQPIGESTSVTMVHPTAEVSALAEIGEGCKIWHHTQIREGVRVGANCVIGKGVYVDFGVVVGSCVKVQNMASIYHGTVVEDGVFIGPYACLTNDKYPRAITPTGHLKTEDDWEPGHTVVGYGASIGAASVILPNVRIGRFAMVAAGSVVTSDIPDHALVCGNPARVQGYVCKCGKRVPVIRRKGAWRIGCTVCNTELVVQGPARL